MDHSNFFNSRSNLVDPKISFLIFCFLLLLVHKSRFNISPSKPSVEKPRNLLNLAKQLSSHRHPFPSRSYNKSSNSTLHHHPRISPLGAQLPIVAICQNNAQRKLLLSLNHRDQTRQGPLLRPSSVKPRRKSRRRELPTPPQKAKNFRHTWKLQHAALRQSSTLFSPP